MAGDVGLGDGGRAIAVVDAPIDTRKDGSVDASDPSVVAAGVVFGAVVLGAVGGDAAEDFDVGFDWHCRKGERDAGAKECAVNVAGQVTSGVAGDCDGAEMGETVVDAEGPGERP